MEDIQPETVSAVLKSVSSYGSQLAAVFHNFSLIADRIPSGFEGAVNILDATVTTLNQVLGLLKDENGPSARINGKILFNEEGLKYVRLLALECASTLAKVEPAIEEGLLDRKDRKALLKQKKRASKKPMRVLDPLSLSLDEKELLEKTEKTKWSWVIGDIEKCMERLYELQLHLLLVFQVGTVCIVSRDLSSEGIDIERLVAYHERIHRTVDLVGIEPSMRQSANSRPRYGRRDSLSSLDFSSDSDSDSIMSRRSLGRPPPPPPPGTRQCPIVDLTSTSGPNVTKELDKTEDPVVRIESTNPPSYSDSRKPEVTGNSNSGSNSTLLETMTSAISDEKRAPVDAYPKDEKISGQKLEGHVDAKCPEPAVPEARLFRLKSTGLGFKFKTFFRSKDSLAEEMRQTLSDAETQLTAFVISQYSSRAVPHSAFHSLEATHMKTILSQLNNNSWYKTYSTLEASEHATLDRMLHPWFKGKIHERELVVLKVLQQNRLNAWVVLANELFRGRSFSEDGSGRVLLAICREKLVDGKPISLGGSMPPPPPPPGMRPPPGRGPGPRNILYPPQPHPTSRTSKISDLKHPGPPPPPPPGWNPYTVSPPPPAFSPSSKKSACRISDTTPLTDHDAKQVLISYNEYSVRPCEPILPTEARSWSRVTVTQESAELNLVRKRVEQFEARDGNVIETKLRLTEQQSGQVTRIMDEIKSSERDNRFDWCWAEISLHNHAGEITNFVPGGPGNVIGSATIMHLIAKRMLRPQYKALDVYNSLIKLGPSPFLGTAPVLPPGPPAIVFPTPRRRRARRGSFSDSDSDSTSWSSDTSVGNVRRRLRKHKAKQEKSKIIKRCINSDSDSEDEEEDVIKINLELKRGDDVVKKLLELWTGGSESKGKGKMT